MSGEPPSPKAQLGAHGLFPKRSFGQNFLADGHLAARIAALTTSSPGGTVVEIGAGLGALTAPLLARAARVIAIERDRDLVPALAARFADELQERRLSVIEADAKTVDYATLLANEPKPHVLAGNLPYQITGPLLERSVALARSLDRAVFLVQLEVADRLAADPGAPAYGALSVFVQAQYHVDRLFVVRRGAFYPQPGVDSAIVALVPHQQPLAEETPTFRDLVHRAFRQRRKMLRNAWRDLLGGDSAALATAAARAEIDLDARGETLDVTAFSRMAKELGP
ncbi:MAG: ribosomal RNA small subunit methyltransferase A [Polyangiaceae bacterium]|nr:ribosomal RNA small subunit methyltransferase A [Polyangiaceae bacterium]